METGSLFFGQPMCLGEVNYYVGVLVLQLITTHEGAESIIFTPSPFFSTSQLIFIIKHGIFL